MCGIVGSFNLPNANAWVQSVLIDLKRRGPDSQIIIPINDSLIMGVARLAMTDTCCRSNQPMIDPISGDAISFNGEVYNYKDIQGQLESRGYFFQTESDTEVILKYLNCFGTGNLKNINGMFAVAYFNKLTNKLYLMRDKLGKKPLYYKLSKNSIQWSSQISSLLSKDNKVKIEETGLIQYLSLGYLIDPVTTTSKVLAVNPGEVIEFDLITNSVTKSRHSLEESLDTNFSGSINELISASVQTRVVGHEKVAISLSGGVDSTIVALEASKLDVEIKAFSIFWPDSDKARYNFDSEAAKNISKSLRVKLHLVPIPFAKDIEKNIDLYLDAMGEPSNNPTGISMINLYKEIANEDFRLALTGDGSDEIFGGYDRYLKAGMVPPLLKFKANKYHSMYFKDVTSSSASFISKILSTQIDYQSPLHWLNWHWVFTPRELGRLLKLDRKLIFLTMQDSINQINWTSSPINAANALMERDHKIWLAMESNRKLDRTSMYYSIEARSPFQDNNIIDWAFEYMSKSEYKEMGKKHLWNAYPEIEKLGVLKKKAGFTSPVGHWIRSNPKLVNESIEFLALNSLFDPHELRKFTTAGVRGNFRELMQLWTLIVLAKWQKR